LGDRRVRRRINHVLLLFLAGLIVGVQSAQAQGTVIFDNYDPARGINAPFYDVFVGGTKLEGTNYFAQLFGGPEGTPQDGLLPVSSPVNFRTGAAAGYLDVGTGLVVAIPGVPFGSTAVVQVRAWSANGGNTWADASASPQVNLTVHTGVKTVSSPEDPDIPGLVGLFSLALSPPFMDCYFPPYLRIDWSNGLPCLSMTVYPGRGYALDCTSSLSANHLWRLLLNQTNVMMPQIFVDSSATGAVQRFYRLREIGR
jgi:hypothetical protein